MSYLFGEGASLLGSVNIFTQTLAFDATAFNTWKNNVKVQEAGEPQTLDTTTHSNTRPHSNHSNHSNSGHSNYTHSDSYPHSNNHNNGPDHSNYYYAGSNRTDPTYGEHQNVPASHYDNSGGHTNTGHSNYYHSDSSPHSNSHSNSRPHSNTAPHTNIGFDHQNYIPSDTHFFADGIGIAADQVIKGTTTIGFYAYDKNVDGYGSQDALSTTVKYYLAIKPASDSVWTSLVSGSTSETYDLDTTAYPDGSYDLRAWAINDTRSERGVTKQYVGVATTVRVQIKQNTVSAYVNNGNEFINFTFSQWGALSPGGTVYIYDNHNQYSAPYSYNRNKYKGIFVVVKMKDIYRASWQKGTAILKDPDGATLATSPVMWSEVSTQEGSEIVRSDDSEKTGYVYFDRSSFPNDAILQNCRVRIEVREYADSACTQPTGDEYVSEQVSATNPAILYVNIVKALNAEAPVVTLRINDGEEYTVSSTVTLNIGATDNYTPPNRLKYRVSLDGTSWKKYEGGAWVAADASWGNYTADLSAPGFNIGPDPGMKYIFVQVMDEDLNVGSAVGKISYASDETLSTNARPPYENLDGYIIMSSGTPAMVLQKEAVSIQFENINDVSEVLTSFDGTNWTSEKLPQGATEHTKEISFPSQGKKAVHFKFRNAAGAESKVFTRYYHVDYTPPVISVATESGAAASKADDNTIRIRITASDNVSTTFYYSINEDGYDVLPADGVITCSLAPGQNVLVIKVVDEAGNIAQDTITVWKL